MRRLLLHVKMRFWTAILIIFVGVSFLFGSLHIYGDGAGNYFLYRQLMEKNWTLSIADPPLDLPGSYIFTRATRGWSTFYQIGAPSVWALSTPLAFFLPDMTPAFASLFGLPANLLYDGFVILFISSLLSIGTLLVWTRALHNVFKFSSFQSATSSLAAFVGLSSWYYAFLAPSYAHVVELFFLTSALPVFFSALQNPSLQRFAVAGLLIGIAALVRIDAILYTFILAWVISVKFRRSALRPLAAIIAPCLIVLGFQFIVWHYVFESAFPSFGYRPDNFTLPLHTADVLFSGSRGLFIWSPIAIVGFIGITWLLRDRRSPHWIAACMGAMLLLSYALFYGAWGMWWGGLSFGQRFLIPLFPFVAFGVAAVLRSLRSLSRLPRAAGMFMVSAAAMYTFSLALMYPAVAQWGRIALEEDATPLQVFKYAAHQYPLGDRTQRKRSWQAWYNATPRPLHLIFP